MKILIADKLSPKVIKKLESIGASVTMNPELSADDLPGAIADSEVLVVRSTKVKAETINAATDLSLIIRAGAGVNTIDLDCASNRGIHVTNCPGKNTDAVAELAIGLLVAADRRIVSASADLAAGQWKKKEYQKSRGLKSRTLGVLGLGSIGMAVVKKAKGLEMEVVAWSRSLTPEKAEELGIEYCDSPLAVAAAADAVTVHLAAKGETKHLVNAEFLAKMGEGTILINTSRGEIVDTSALIDAIKTKGLRVGLDVYENEPTGGTAEFKDLELAKLASCTPHVGASTDQASEAIAEEVFNIVNKYRETGNPLNVVNVQGKSKAKYNLVVRHYNRVGVLAAVLDNLRDEGVNVEEMENIIFEGGQAATCTMKLDSKPENGTIESIKKNQNVIQVLLT